MTAPTGAREGPTHRYPRVENQRGVTCGPWKTLGPAENDPALFFQSGAAPAHGPDGSVTVLSCSHQSVLGAPLRPGQSHVGLHGRIEGGVEVMWIDLFFEPVEFDLLLDRVFEL